jgi:hypothetical protein
LIDIFHLEKLEASQNCSATCKRVLLLRRHLAAAVVVHLSLDPGAVVEHVVGGAVRTRHLALGLDLAPILHTKTRFFLQFCTYL